MLAYLELDPLEVICMAWLRLRRVGTRTVYRTSAGKIRAPMALACL
jgi:hypothetical protein